MARYSCVLVQICLTIFSMAVIAKSQEVICRVDRFCDQTPGVMSTMEDCCNHNTDPPGLAFTVPGEENCQLCPVVFGFNQTTFAGVERGESYAVEVAFQSGAPLDAPVIYTITSMSGTATDDVDLRLSTTTGRYFPVDDATQLESNIITFTLIVDAVAQEENETFSFQLSITPENSLGADPMLISNVLGTIVDGDTVPFFLSEDDYSESEAPGAAIPVRIAKDQAIRLANPVTFRLTPLTVPAALNRSIFTEFDAEDPNSPNRATEPDFNTTVLTVTFPADEGGAPIPDLLTPISIVDDNYNEAPEQIFVVLLEVIEATNIDLLDITRSFSLGRIQDNDPIQIGFALPQYDFFEPERALIIRNVTLVKEGNRTSEQTFLVVITVSDPVATMVNPADIGVDFNLGTADPTDNSVSRVFPPNAESIMFTFFLQPDDFAEGQEGFQAGSTPAAPALGFPTFQPPTAGLAFATTAITINDNDLAVVGFEQESYTIRENGTQQEVCIVVTNPPPEADLEFDIIVVYQSATGSAGQNDFGRVFNIELFPGGPGSPTGNNLRRECFDVPITDDDIYEEVESFTIGLELDTFDGIQTGVIVQPNLTEIFIVDDDEAVIGFINQPYNASEGDGQAFVEIGVISEGVEREVVVELTLSDESALLGNDFEALDTMTFTFIRNNDSYVVPITLINDNAFELTEMLQASLSLPGEAPPRVRLSPDSAQVTIFDDDVVEFGFDPATYTFSESVGNGVITLSHSSGDLGAGISAVLTVNTSDVDTDNSATAGEDYQPLVSVMSSFSGSPSNVPLQIPIAPDNLTEGDEIFQALIVQSAILLNGEVRVLSSQESSRITVTQDRAEITITDDDNAVIGFINQPYTASEGDGQAVVEIGVISGSLEREVVVELSLSDGSAIFGGDYGALDVMTFTFGPLSTNFIVNISLVNDGIFELTEMLQANLSFLESEAPPRVTLSPGSAQVTIFDDDVVEFGFDPATYTFMESEGNGVITLSHSRGDLGAGISAVLTVDTSDINADNSATADEDYIPLESVTSSFSGSPSDVSLQIPITPDDLAEGDEIFQALISQSNILLNGDVRVLSPQESSRVVVTQQRAEITIADDDAVTIGFLEPVYSVREDEGPVVFQFGVISGNLGFNVNVSFFTSDDTAIDGADYIQELGIFEVGDGDPVSVPVDIINDMSFEGLEVFSGNLAEPGAEFPANVVIDPRLATAEISDDDAVRIGFEPDEYVVDEDVGVLNFTIRVLSGSLSTDVEVVFSTTDGSAVETEDYEATMMTVTFSPGVDSIMVSVPIKNDMLLEVSETFFGNLSFPSGMIERVTLDPSGASATIQDNDEVVIGFPQNYTVIEGVDGSLTIDIGVLSGMLGRTVEVTVNTADGSAQDPDDYIGSSEVLTFTPDQTTNSIQVTINNDDILEGPENFFARAESDDTGVIISPDQAMVTIIDNDTLVIGFLDTYTVTEGVDDSVSIEIGVRMGTLGSPVEVRVFTDDGSAQAPGDYSSVSQTVTFTPGQTVQTIEVPINNDDILENPENFFARAETDNPSVMIIPDQAMITILDSDSVSVSFEQTSYDVTESDGVLNVTVVLMGEIERPVEVVINTEDGTAVSIGDEADYDPRIQILTFVPSPENRQEIVVQINIRDDPFVENDENLETILSIPPGESGVVIVNPEATVNIIDDDMVTIGFNQTSYSVVENDPSGNVTVSVRVQSGILRIPVTVNLSTSDISALAGSDYTGVGPIPLTFDESVTTRDISIPILNDDLEEPTESFSADLVTSEDPDVVTLDPAMTTILILNDDVSQGTKVNDSVIGDPLFTVPILVPEEDLQALNISKLSLCYEIHGESDQWFNLVTDECTTVNAQYVALTPSLNIIDEIGVRAVDDNGQCVEILMDIDNCSASVNGADLAVMERYSSGGINVRRYSNRVRISVPNCAECTLVMWVTCERRSLDNPDDPDSTIVAEMIKFVVMRGLNFGHRDSHGLLGQYWNVPVRVSQFDGLRRDGSTPLPSALAVNITTRGQTRGFAGWIADITWDFSEGPCLYVGNKQGGPIYEITEPGDGVIESLYKDYRVESAFSEENYGFGMFDESRCIDVLPPSETTSPPGIIN